MAPTAEPTTIEFSLKEAELEEDFELVSVAVEFVLEAVTSVKFIQVLKLRPSIAEDTWGADVCLQM